METGGAFQCPISDEVINDAMSLGFPLHQDLQTSDEFKKSNKEDIQNVACSFRETDVQDPSEDMRQTEIHINSVIRFIDQESSDEDQFFSNDDSDVSLPKNDNDMPSPNDLPFEGICNSVAVEEPLLFISHSESDHSNTVEEPESLKVAMAYAYYYWPPLNELLEDGRPQHPCNLHPQRLASIYCETCFQSACHKCSLTVHSGHNCSMLNDVLAATEDEARRFLADAEFGIKEIEQRMEEVVVQVLQAEESAATTESRMRDDFCRMQEEMEQTLNEMLDQVKRVNKVRREAGQKRIDALEKSTQKIKDACDVIADGLERGTDADLLLIRPEVVRCNEELEMLRLQPPQQPDHNYVYAPPNSSLLNDLGRIGDISSCGFGPTSSATGRGISMSLVNRVATFRVRAFDHLGRPRSVGGDAVHLVVRAKDHLCKVVTEVKDCRDGTYHINYVPRVAFFSGMDVALALHVYLRGLPIKGSPFRVALHHPRHYAEIGTTVLESFGGVGNGDGEMCRPWGICCDASSNIVVADRSNDRIQVFQRGGHFLYSFGSSGHAPGQLYRPAGVAIDERSDGVKRIVVADKDNHRVQVFTFDGKLLRVIGEKGSNNGQFTYPWDVAVNEETHDICVSDSRNLRVQLFSEDGRFLSVFSSAAASLKDLESPRGVAFDQQGNVIITDFNQHRLVVLDSDFRFSRYIGRLGGGPRREPFNRPQGIAVDPQGNYVVADSKNHQIHILRPNGAPLRTFGCEGFELGQFKKPTGVCVSREGLIHVVDFENHRVQVF